MKFLKFEWRFWHQILVKVNNHYLISLPKFGAKISTQFWSMSLWKWKLLVKFGAILNSGVQSKNNEYHIVNKVENQSIYEWILNLIDNVVFVVFALYSRIVLSWTTYIIFFEFCSMTDTNSTKKSIFENFTLSLPVLKLNTNPKKDFKNLKIWN